MEKKVSIKEVIKKISIKEVIENLERQKNKIIVDLENHKARIETLEIQVKVFQGMIENFESLISDWYMKLPESEEEEGEEININNKIRKMGWDDIKLVLDANKIFYDEEFSLMHLSEILRKKIKDGTIKESELNITNYGSKK